MTRRLVLLASLAACLRADSEKEVEEFIASAASALSAGEPERFLEAFDHSMPDFEKLRYLVVGLTSQTDVSCSIEIQSNEGDDALRALTLDWILRADKKGASAGSTHREKTVRCQLKRTGKKWRIVSFEPLDLFAPPSA
jgi:hypothetical protein